ncbi:MAG: cell surface protein SprA, partial [candidate division Zixibacteria bacterium]|nr:cell surface protein SprA [candidate division Zixibacteria bacterium]
FPDGKMDDRQDIFREDWGLLIFPEREPFNSSHRFQDSTGNVTMKLDVKVPDIYEYTDRQKTDASEYFIRLATRSRSSIIRLQRANIIEGSERVVVNGQTLTRDTDYRIDYSFGQITLLSAKATDPNANVSIEFEYAPFLAIQKKTLLGFRAEYEWSSDFRFGTTLLYKSDKAQERKPRVGQETAKSYVYDFDASLKLRPQFLTAAADALPLVETEAASNLSVSGEIAQSRPNPNVDGVAYVDDFESAVDHLSLGSSRTLWQLSSRPGQVDAGYVKGKLLWHTPRDLVRVDDVYDRDVAQGQGTIRTFRMIFRPKVADTTWTEEGTREITPLLGYNSWAGIMRYFHARVDSKRAQLFEVRMRGTDRGKLHFDFGRISEDANGDGVPNSEDNPPYGDNNGAVDENEDTGVDQIPDPMEDQYSAANPDPNGDNWYFLGEGKCPLPSGECNDIDWEDDSIRYEWLNGTEGNLKDISVLGRPDKEALSANGWQTTNAYFSYVIDLADDTRFLVEGSQKDDWRTYRIPIRDTLALDTTFTTDAAVKPDWSQVTHVRIWFESADNQIEWDTVEVANWYFVQSNWQDSVISPPGTLEEDRANLVVASVSQEDGTFDPPPGVTAYKDPTSNVTETQRGLLMRFENLDHLDTCLATKELLSVDRYSGYRNLEMYVYGGTGIAEGRIRFFFRIGDDADNFYEYRTFVYEGWDSRNFVRFDFNDITAFKDSLIRSAPKSE